MVSHTGRTPDTRRIRRLKAPAGIEVQADSAGTPVCLRFNGAWQDVTPVRRPWRIDQHWWRIDAVSRTYYRVAPEDGPALTIYYDLLAKTWARQEY